MKHNIALDTDDTTGNTIDNTTDDTTGNTTGNKGITTLQAI